MTATRLARCKAHGIRLVAYCPACRGTQGGKSTSSAKAAAARRNAQRARAKRVNRADS